jgi:N-acetyl-gamma-glutamyl-phosphate reductase
MAYRAAVVGGSGYTGAELLRLLAAHPEVDVVHATADTNAGTAVGELFPSLAGAYPALVFETFEPGDLHGLDVVFCALPHGTSQRELPALLDHVGHVVDLGADFRLPPPLYATWYGEQHGAPAALERFVYGLPELFRADLGAAVHVAAPGCYPTTAALALAPLLARGLVEPTGIIVDALSGISGRGRALSPASLFSEANESVTAYGLLTHRHTGEIEHALRRVAPDRDVQVLFTPHLVPMTRGILATCHARPTQAIDSAALLDVYREHYAGEPFVRVVDEPPATKSLLGSNACHVTVRHDPRTGSILALGALDNLVKGASGQAIQALNCVLDLPETAGLSSMGIVP